MLFNKYSYDNYIHYEIPTVFDNVKTINNISCYDMIQHFKVVKKSDFDDKNFDLFLKYMFDNRDKFEIIEVNDDSFYLYGFIDDSMLPKEYPSDNEEVYNILSNLLIDIEAFIISRYAIISDIVDQINYKVENYNYYSTETFEETIKNACVNSFVDDLFDFIIKHPILVRYLKFFTYERLYYQKVTDNITKADYFYNSNYKFDNISDLKEELGI